MSYLGREFILNRTERVNDKWVTYSTRVVVTGITELPSGNLPLYNVEALDENSKFKTDRCWARQLIPV